MERYNILSNYPELAKNILCLEQQGKTVVIMAINLIPQLVLSLQETHLTKSEAPFVINYMQNIMKLKVCIITGDNRHAAMEVAQYLEIPSENVTYEAYPETKREVVERY